MILRAIDLEFFGRFCRSSFEFRRGLNLVVGPNEAGKSTLMESIPAILFGVRDKQRYAPWGRTAHCRGALRFETHGGSVRVQRDLKTDEVGLEWTDQLYQTQRHVSGKASPQGRSGEKRVYLQELQELLGFGDADLFRATLFFGQGDLALDFGKSLSARIKAILSGSAEINYEQVLAGLQDALFDVTRENPWGKDKTRDRQLELAEKELGRIEQRLSLGAKAYHELQGVETELQELESALEEDRMELSRGEKYLQWIKTYWQLEAQGRQIHEQLATLMGQQEKREDLTARRNRLVAQLKADGVSCADRAGQELHERLQEARRVLLQWRRLQQEQHQLQNDLGEDLNAIRFLPWAWGLLIGATAVYGVLKYPLWQLHIILAGVLATVPMLLWSFWRRGCQAMRRGELRGRAQMQQQQRLELQRQLDDLALSLQAAGVPLRLEEIASHLESLEGHEHSLRELGEIDSALAVLPEAASLEEKARLLREELIMVDQRRQEGRTLREGVDLDVSEIDEADHKLEQLRQRVQATEKEQQILWRRRAECSAVLGDRALLEEERGEVLQDVLRLQSRKRVLSLACDVLQSSVKEFSGGYLERFSVRLEPLLEVATDGAYREARLKENLAIELRARSGQWKPLELFSQGTRDAVAVAVRLAFVEVFSSGRKLPLLLDDAFVNLDSSRQTRMLRLLKRLSADHQVILFSHDERLAKRAARERWHVLTLENRNQPVDNATSEASNAGQLHLL